MVGENYSAYIYTLKDHAQCSSAAQFFYHSRRYEENGTNRTAKDDKQTDKEIGRYRE